MPTLENHTSRNADDDNVFGLSGRARAPRTGDPQKVLVQSWATSSPVTSPPASSSPSSSPSSGSCLLHDGGRRRVLRRTLQELQGQLRLRPRGALRPLNTSPAGACALLEKRGPPQSRHHASPTHCTSPAEHQHEHQHQHEHEGPHPPHPTHYTFSAFVTPRWHACLHASEREERGPSSWGCWL